MVQPLDVNSEVQQRLPHLEVTSGGHLVAQVMTQFQW